MAGAEVERYLGVGIYSVPEAARLSGVSVGRIRRWLKGYTYAHAGDERSSPPVWQGQLPEVDGRLALGFLDLIEVRFVDAFRRRGVSWKALRLGAQRACTLFDSTHPFSTRRFKTDGRGIFTKVYDEEGEESLLDVVRNQYAFNRILSPYLKGLEFGEDDNPLRWWPIGMTRRVVIDPARSFGQPIVSKEGVPTVVLAKAVKAEGSIEAVGNWYDVEPRSVRDAVDFEEKLAA